MKLYAIESGTYKVDGGAFFGVVPKVNWSKFCHSDELNRCTIAMRSLVVKTGDRVVLIDTGMGSKQNDKFYKYHELERPMDLVDSLGRVGITADEVTDVFLTHLHFDHCGGGVAIDAKGNFSTVFKNATYWSNEDHWRWATEANCREKYSFLKENIEPIQASGQLKFLAENDKLADAIEVHFLYGHTVAMMMPIVNFKGRKVAFVSDLIPSIAHIPVPYIMAYDINPLKAMEEKKSFLERAVDEKIIFFLQHDANAVCCTVRNGLKYPELDTVFDLKEIPDAVLDEI